MPNDNVSNSNDKTTIAQTVENVNVPNTRKVYPLRIAKKRLKKESMENRPLMERCTYIYNFKEDSNVPCSLPRAAGIKRKRVQTDARDRTLKKEKYGKLSNMRSTNQRDVAEDGNVSPYFSPSPPTNTSSN